MLLNETQSPNVARLAKLYELAQTEISTRTTEGREPGALFTLATESTQGMDSKEVAKLATESAREIKSFGNRIASNTDAEIQGLTARQKQVGEMLLAAACGGAEKGLTAYQAQLATESTRAPMDNVIESTHFSDFGSKPQLAREYFNDKTDYNQLLGLSFALNVRAVETQSKFAETLFPTIVVTSGDSGIVARTRRLTTYQGMRHALYSEDSFDADRRNLIDGLTDHTVLEDDNGIALVPFYNATGDDKANIANFVSEDIVAPYITKVGSISYKTSWLKFGMDRNLFSLAAHPGIAAEGYNETDEIAPGSALSGLLVAIYPKGKTVRDGSLIELDVLNTRYATFQPPATGTGRELTINFRENKFTLDANTLDRNGDAISALAQMNQRNLRLQFEPRFNLDIQTNNGKESSSQAEVRNIVAFNSSDAIVTGDDIDAVINGIVIEVLGYQYKMTRTNENRRSIGRLIEHVWEKETWMLRMGSPLTTKTPIGADTDGDMEKLDDLNTAINMRNEVQSVSQILNYSKTLKQVADSIIDPYEVANIQGLGRYWITPWFEEKSVHIPDVVSTLESKFAPENARASLLTILADQVTRAVQQSRYMATAKQYTGDKEVRPTIVIATDEAVASMLLFCAEGENTLLHDRYRFEVVTTNDSRFYPKDEQKGLVHRLQWFAKIPTEDGSVCVINPGNHFWTAPIVTNTNITRQNTTTRELTVQPRNLHVNHCPMSGVLHITGITDWAATKPTLAVKVLNAVSTEDTLDGLSTTSTASSDTTAA